MKSLKSVLLGALCVAIALYPLFLRDEPSSVPPEKAILRLWQIDSFEGGIGSRSAFLERTAKRFEQTHSVYLMITSHTRESALQSMEAGNFPDMISFGPGLDNIASLAVEIDGAYAQAWCVGKYCLYSLEDDFSDVSAETVLVSASGCGLAVVAARLAGLRGTLTVQPSLTAYVNFLNGKAKYLLGTQRDLYRFRTKGVSVCLSPLEGFSDLMQYISVLTAEGELSMLCREFVAFLCSEETQKTLPRIGMYSMTASVYETEPESTLERAHIDCTVPYFSSGEALQQLYAAALGGAEEKIWRNYLKGVDS